MFSSLSVWFYQIDSPFLLRFIASVRPYQKVYFYLTFIHLFLFFALFSSSFTPLYFPKRIIIFIIISPIALHNFLGVVYFSFIYSFPSLPCVFPNTHPLQQLSSPPPGSPLPFPIIHPKSLKYVLLSKGR